MRVPDVDPTGGSEPRDAGRAAAAGGSLLVLAALLTIWVARLTVPRELYVSELGAAGEPTAGWFMVALVLIVAGASLIAWAARGIRSRPVVLRAWRPAVSLWISAGFFLLASQVTCTSGCPLPYGPTFTWQDFVHTSAAVLAFGFACWAMLQCSFAVGQPLLARFSLAASLSVAAIAGAGGLMSVFRWETGLGSRLELAATTLGLAWVLAFGIGRVVGGRAPRSHAGRWSAAMSAAQRTEQFAGE